MAHFGENARSRPGDVVTIFKDQSLDGLADRGNVAQFVSGAELDTDICRMARQFK
jgi:hypothetical protein